MRDVSSDEFAMPQLFQDEPDEVSPFHDQPDETDPNEGMDLVFQDEPDEPEDDAPPASLLYRDEPDETEGAIPLQPTCFADEPDELSSDSGNSGCLADVEMGPDAETTKGLVSLSFSTVSQFLSTQLCKAGADSGAAAEPKKKKKRCYNNMNRKAAADERKEKNQDTKKQTRIPRNDVAPSIEQLSKFSYAHPTAKNMLV